MSDIHVIKNKVGDDATTFHVEKGERIVEGKSVFVRDKGKKRILHVLIYASKNGTRSCCAEAPEGFPIPGKGENAYDCGEDAIYGLYTKARTVREAVKKFMDDVRQTRKKRGDR